MPGQDLKLVAGGQARRIGDARQLGGARGFGGLGVPSRVDFQGVSPDRFRLAHLVGVGIEEDAHTNARLVHLPDEVLHRRGLEDDVESALRCQLLRPLGHERHLIGANLLGDARHVRCDRHFDVQLRRDGVP